MTRWKRWCLAVPVTALASLAAYYLTGRALASVAVLVFGKSASVDVSLGIALHFQHRYFLLLSILLASVCIGVQPSPWRRWGLAALALMVAPSIAYWVAMARHAPNWAALVLASTAAGLSVPLLLMRATLRRAAHGS